MIRDKLAERMALREERRKLEDKRFYELMKLVVYGTLGVFGSILGLLICLLMR